MQQAEIKRLQSLISKSSPLPWKVLKTKGRDEFGTVYDSDLKMVASDQITEYEMVADGVGSPNAELIVALRENAESILENEKLLAEKESQIYSLGLTNKAIAKELFDYKSKADELKSSLSKMLMVFSKIQFQLDDRKTPRCPVCNKSYGHISNCEVLQAINAANKALGDTATPEVV